MKRDTNETTAQRREKQRAEDIRALEKLTREVVEVEHVLAGKRDALTALRERLLSSVTRIKRRPIPERILAVARMVSDAAHPIGRTDVAEALGITGSNAGMRLALAVERNLIERAERGLYRGIARNVVKTNDSDAEATM